MKLKSDHCELLANPLQDRPVGGLGCGKTIAKTSKKKFT